MKIHLYYVYIMATENNRVIYIGVTNDILRRVNEHRNSLIPGFTNRYNVHKLVFLESFGFIEDAIHREKQLKKWRRQWKNEVINKVNPHWNDLTLTL